MSDSGKTFEGKVDLIGYGVLPDDEPGAGRPAESFSLY